MADITITLNLSVAGAEYLKEILDVNNDSELCTHEEFEAVATLAEILHDEIARCTNIPAADRPAEHELYPIADGNGYADEDERADGLTIGEHLERYHKQRPAMRKRLAEFITKF